MKYILKNDNFEVVGKQYLNGVGNYTGDTTNASDLATVVNNKVEKTDIPTEETVSGWGFTKNQGTVTDVKVNGVSLVQNNGEVNITVADLSITSALKYCGITTTKLTDGATTNPVVIDGKDHTATQGCVVFYEDINNEKTTTKEFVFNGSKWELLGSDLTYKVVQNAVSSPNANGDSTAFIDTISQDANGVITATKKNVDMPIVKGDAENSAVLKGEYQSYSNKAISQTSMAIGGASNAGLKGWYYTKVNLDTNSIWLSNDRLVDKVPIIGTVIGLKIETTTATEPDDKNFTCGWKVGDEVTIVNEKKYERCAKISSINGNMITLDKLPFTSETIYMSAPALGDLNEPDEFSITAFKITDNDTFKTRTLSSYDKGGVDFGGGASSIGVQTYAINIGAHAEGIQTVAYGQYSHTEGFKSQAGYAAHAEGKQTLASGEQSHAEGENTTASGKVSHAEGSSTKATNHGSHAEGRNTTSSADSSHSEGYKTTASGAASHAEGWENTASAEASHAEGRDTKATGKYSHAEGKNTQATNVNAHAEGYYSIAAGDTAHAEGCRGLALGGFSHVEGCGSTIPDNITELSNDEIETLWDANKNFNIVKGSTSHSEGVNNLVLGNYSHGEGGSVKVNGEYSHAEGRETKSTANYSHAEGRLSKALSSHSHAEGYDTTASGVTSHAEGEYTIASGQASHAEGYKTTASGAASHTEGWGNTAIAEASHAEGKSTIAKGNYSHSEGNETAASGAASHTEGYYTRAEGDYSHAEGYKTTASGYNSHAEGSNTTASGYNSHAEGSSTKAQGNESHAEGRSTTASGECSHAEGYNSKAIGRLSHAEGHSTTASGYNSHAEGSSTTASGDYSHAEGYQSKANGFGAHAEGGYYNNDFDNAIGGAATGAGAHAEGIMTKATKQGAHAEGHSTTASGHYSHAEGWYTIANNTAEHASGKYNASIPKTADNTTAEATHFSIGIGTSEDDRKNAFEVKQNGDIYIEGVEGRIQDKLNEISNINQIIEDNEEVTAAALNVLNSDIKQIYKIVGIEGDTLNASNGFFQESDENLKIFISNIEVDLEKIAQLPKKFFMWSDKRDENIHIGTSAQAVQELYPEIVKRDKNGNLMVDYSKLSVIALRAIDVLNEERKQMKADIAEIKNKLGL